MPSIIISKSSYNLTNLQIEINSLIWTNTNPVKYINGSDSNVEIFFDGTITAQQRSEVESVVSSHSAVKAVSFGLNAVRYSKAFGIDLMERFSGENVELGITQLGLTSKVRKVCREVKDCLDTGSLYDAIEEISQISSLNFDSKILTAVRLLKLRNEIEKYLKVPLATSYNQAATWK